MAASKTVGNVSEGRDSILEPLSLPERPGCTAPPDNSMPVPCLLCTESCSPAEKEALLKHMVLEHKLVISDVKLIADFQRYILYWKKRFAEHPITEFCSVIRTNSEGPVERQEDYFLLCDVLPEDRVLREQLQQKRLEAILEQQQKERNETIFHRTCMFCTEEFTGNRSFLLNHMAKEHDFNMGLPDNIVFCEQFLDTLQRKLDKLLYRVTVQNELGKTWEEVQSEDDREMMEDHDDDWSDWQDHPVCAVCLFCEHQSETMDRIYSHMEETHGFDLHKIKAELGLNFYEQVKLVNFIRREIHQCQCYGCQDKFSSKTQVLEHLMDAKHVMALPEKHKWDQPQYYFPTYENDALLCALSDSESESESCEQRKDIPVIAEDISNLQALKQKSVLNQLLKGKR
nr:PREDICTED: zinc finger protein 277 [Lepisosteus oculatus]